MDETAQSALNKLDELMYAAADQLVVACQQRIDSILARPEYTDPLRLERHGFKGYSQQDEDGLLQEIFRRIGVTDRSFIEIGVGSGLENNTLYLLYQGWHGVWIESDRDGCNFMREKFRAPLDAGELKLLEQRVTAENINGLLQSAGFAGPVDLLGLDIDGNDYHVFEAIQAVSPRVVVIEYNARFRPPVKLVQPYDPDYTWDGTDHFGASLAALHELARGRGYALVGTNLTGANAFFVKSDLARGKFCPDDDAASLYNPARYRLVPGFDNGHRPNFRPYLLK